MVAVVKSAMVVFIGKGRGKLSVDGLKLLPLQIAHLLPKPSQTLLNKGLTLLVQPASPLFLRLLFRLQVSS